MPRGAPLFARIRPRRLPPQIQGRLSKHKKLLRARLTFSFFSKTNLATSPGLIKNETKNAKTPGVSQFWAKKANPIHGQLLSYFHRSCGTAAVRAGSARTCPVLPDLEVPPDPVRKRFLTRRSTGGRSYALRNLSQTTTR